MQWVCVVRDVGAEFLSSSFFWSLVFGVEVYW